MRRCLLIPICAGVLFQLAACHAAPGASEEAPASRGATTLSPSPEPAAESEPASLAGRYLATGPASATLELTQAGDGVWHLVLRGGAVPNGAATAADCELHAQGTRSGDRIEAVAMPFEGELNSMTVDDLGDTPARITLELGDAQLTVDTDGHLPCAMGVEFDGVYRRSRATS